VADWLGTPTHVLRFWESRFSQVKPVKRAGGRRYYRPADMELLGGIKKLLHDDGLTIRGVQKILREEGVKHVAALSQPVDALLDDMVEEAGFARDVQPEPQTATIVSMTPPEPEAAAAPPADEPVAETPRPEAPATDPEAPGPVSTWADAMAAAKVSETQADVAEEPPVESHADATMAEETPEVRVEAAQTPDAAIVSDDETPVDAPADAAPEFAQEIADGAAPAGTAAPEPVSEPETINADAADAAPPVSPPMPDPVPAAGPRLGEQVLAALRARPSVDRAKLRPLYDRLSALRQKMPQDRAPH
jgi:DNA-binding transcriptional MerR regulator